MSTFIKNSQNIKVNIQSSSPQNTTEKMKTDVNVCDRAGDDVIRLHKQSPPRSFTVFTFSSFKM